MLRTFLRKGPTRNFRLSQKIFYQEKSEKNKLSQKIEKVDEKIAELDFEQEQIEQGLTLQSKSKKEHDLLEEYGIGTSTKNVRGLADFFRHPAFWGSGTDVTTSMSGKPWNRSFLKDLTHSELHELWYILLRERNILKTEKYAFWKKGESYDVPVDPESTIAESMFNIKQEIKHRKRQAKILKGEPERSMKITTMYDTSPALEGKTVELDSHKTPPTLEKPVGYPDDPNTHHIANFYPQDIEQPVEIAFYDKNDIDKLGLKEDADMQEDFYWTKVQKLWEYYVSQQKKNLSPKDWKIRLEDGFYPREMPTWWREMHSHKNMWKYGIWPQHSLVAHEKANHQKKKIIFEGKDYYHEKKPI